MKAVVDDRIPHIRGQIERLVDQVVYLPGRDIGASDVRDADVLIVRTRTRCDRTLLEGSRVRFIATATIGYDHLDTGYLQQAGIEWHNCPGCNATSVAQYVRNCLLLLQRERGIELQGCCVGIIGVGHVGRAVAEALRPLGVKLLLNDPPRAEREGAEGFATLQELQRRCQIITCHTPLVRDGRYPTMHLVDEAFLHAMRRGAVLINAGRGEVVDNAALERALDEGHIAEAVIDTWEGEPDVSPSLLNKVYIGTPHVAGYSADGKANATRMTLQALGQWMGRTDVQWDIRPQALPPTLVPSADEVERHLQLYDPRQDSERLKNDPAGFELQRGNYPLRRERWG